MANVILKTDFVDGEKLFAQQLNNNFSAIMAALAAMNKITWQDDPDDSVITFRGTTEEVNQREIIDGQLLYDTTTGETYIDYGSQRISTGSGNAIFIGDTVPTNPSTQLWIDPSEPIQTLGSEVTNTLDGNDINKAPSVAAVKNYINKTYSVTDEVKTNEIWLNGKYIYEKVIRYTVNSNAVATISLEDLGYDRAWIDFSNSFSHYDGTDTCSGINYYVSSTDYGVCYINASKKLTINNHTTVSRPYTITIRFTKENDEVITSEI